MNIIDVFCYCEVKLAQGMKYRNADFHGHNKTHFDRYISNSNQKNFSKNQEILKRPEGPRNVHKTELFYECLENNIVPKIQE